MIQGRTQLHSLHTPHDIRVRGQGQGEAYFGPPEVVGKKCDAARVVRGQTETLTNGGLHNTPSTHIVPLGFPPTTRQTNSGRQTVVFPFWEGVGSHKPNPPSVLPFGCCLPAHSTKRVCRGGGGGGHQWSGCSVRMELGPRLLPTAFIAHCPHVALPAPSGPPMFVLASSSLRAGADTHWSGGGGGGGGFGTEKIFGLNCWWAVDGCY